MKVIRSILVHLFTGANIATILLLWACCGSTYLHPADFPRLGLLGLAFPFLLIPNILFIFFWLIFKTKRIWLPIFGLLACFPFLRAYYPVNWQSEAPDTTALSILSYNTCYYGRGPTAPENSKQDCINYIAESGADIICLQESSREADLEKEMKAQGYELYNSHELAIYSRLPILSVDTISIAPYLRFALKAFLLDGQDTIMLINQHLQSNKLSKQMKTAYRKALEQHESDSVRKELRPIIQLLSEALPRRAAQADTLASIIEQWQPRPVILCGDFNDTPVSYPHRVLTRHLTSAYCQSGHGVGFTFQEKGFPVRIDHILFSDDRWTSHETYVDKSILCSDHYPILTKLVKKAP